MVLLTNCLGAAHFSINQQKRLGHHLPPIPHLGCAVAGRLGRGRSGGLSAGRGGVGSRCVFTSSGRGPLSSPVVWYAACAGSHKRSCRQGGSGAGLLVNTKKTIISWSIIHPVLNYVTYINQLCQRTAAFEIEVPQNHWSSRLIQGVTELPQNHSGTMMQFETLAKSAKNRVTSRRH